MQKGILDDFHVVILLDTLEIRIVFIIIAENSCRICHLYGGPYINKAKSLNINARTKYHGLVLMHKIVTKKAPVYL